MLLRATGKWHPWSSFVQIFDQGTNPIWKQGLISHSALHTREPGVQPTWIPNVTLPKCSRWVVSPKKGMVCFENGVPKNNKLPKRVSFECWLPPCACFIHKIIQRIPTHRYLHAGKQTQVVKVSVSRWVKKLHNHEVAMILDRGAAIEIHFWQLFHQLEWFFGDGSIIALSVTSWREKKQNKEPGSVK